MNNSNRQRAILSATNSQKRFAILFLAFVIAFFFTVPNVLAATDGDTNKVTISVKHTGQDLPTEIFKFKIEAGAGEHVTEDMAKSLHKNPPLPSSTEVSIDGEGKTSFPEITFSESGIYSYLVSEIPGNTEGMTYDSSVYNVLVYVESGPVVREVVILDKSGMKPEDIKFTDSYEKPASSTDDPDVSEDDEGKDTPTEDPDKVDDKDTDNSKDKPDNKKIVTTSSDRNASGFVPVSSGERTNAQTGDYIIMGAIIALVLAIIAIIVFRVLAARAASDDDDDDDEDDDEDEDDEEYDDEDDEEYDDEDEEDDEEEDDEDEEDDEEERNSR